MMHGKIGLVFNGVWSHWAFATAPKYRDVYRLIYTHDLDASALEDLDAVVVPFQSDHGSLNARRDVLTHFADGGHTLAYFGDTQLEWFGARWQSRPVDNTWWARTPVVPPIVDTDRTHPLYASLSDRHSGWHHHGVYTDVPAGARVLQRNRAGEIVTWEAPLGRGRLFASTKDPIVEHGVQQIRHLDHYCDALTAWLCGVRPVGPFTIDPSQYGVALDVEPQKQPKNQG